MSQVSFLSVRVAGTPKFTPSHISARSKDGKPVSDKVEFSVIENITGNNPKKYTYKVTAWGKLAVAIARTCSAGKKLGLTCDISSYRGRVWVDRANGVREPVLLADGTFLTTEKVAFTVTTIDFGADSLKHIQNEIVAYNNNNGTVGRPTYWEVPGHPDNVIWKEICNRQNAAQFQPGMQRFGYAEVVIPEGATIVAPQTTGTAYTHNAAPTQAYKPAAPTQTYAPAQQIHQPQQNNSGGYFIDQNNHLWINGIDMGIPAGAHQPNTQTFATGGFQPAPTPATQPAPAPQSFAPPTNGGQTHMRY